MSSIEDFNIRERQVDLIAAIDRAEDVAYIQEGHGRLVDLYESNRFILGVAAVIHGEKERL